MGKTIVWYQFEKEERNTRRKVRRQSGRVAGYWMWDVGHHTLINVFCDVIASRWMPDSFGNRLTSVKYYGMVKIIVIPLFWKWNSRGSHAVEK